MYVATALTVYGIETFYFATEIRNKSFVATALTVYGIETYTNIYNKGRTPVSCNSAYRLRY